MKQVRVPWGEERSRFTALYEALILDRLHQASIAGAAEMMDLSWDEVYGVMRRGVERRQEQRKLPGEGATAQGSDASSVAPLLPRTAHFHGGGLPHSS